MLPLDQAESADQGKGICGGCRVSLVDVEGLHKTAAGVSSPNSWENGHSAIMGGEITRESH
jgi:hypothetical protein